MHLEPHHVGLIVSDIDASRAFYEALGFEIESQIDAGEMLITFMRLGALELELFCYRETPPPPAPAERVLGFRHFALRTTDIDATVARLQAGGFMPEDVELRDVGFARLAFFHDPDGVEIEILEQKAT